MNQKNQQVVEGFDDEEFDRATAKGEVMLEVDDSSDERSGDAEVSEASPLGTSTVSGQVSHALSIVINLDSSKTVSPIKSIARPTSSKENGVLLSFIQHYSEHLNRLIQQPLLVVGSDDVEALLHPYFTAAITKAANVFNTQGMMLAADKEEAEESLDFVAQLNAAGFNIVTEMTNSIRNGQNFSCFTTVVQIDCPALMATSDPAKSLESATSRLQAEAEEANIANFGVTYILPHSDVIAQTEKSMAVITQVKPETYEAGSSAHSFVINTSGALAQSLSGIASEDSLQTLLFNWVFFPEQIVDALLRDESGSLISSFVFHTTVSSDLPYLIEEDEDDEDPESFDESAGDDEV